MGWSIQKFGSASVMLGDGPLVVLLWLIADEVGKQSPFFPLLRTVLAQWQDNAERSGPGTIRLRLDETMATPAARMELSHALELVRKRLDQEKVIPADTLNAHISAQGMIFNDYPAAPLLDAIGRLRKVLSL